jgi:methionine-rich copper-binding protein CopC
MSRPYVLLGAFASLAVALPLQALHTRLVRAEPGIDSTITAPPKQIRLWFSEPPELALSSASLMKADHSPVAVVKLAATDDSLSVAGPVPITLEPGKYMVMWRTGTKDGHAVKGMYYFTFDSTAQPKP